MTTNDETKLPARAALTVKFHGPTNFKGARWSVDSQHTMGRRYYLQRHELNAGDNARQAAADYLVEMLDLSRREYGNDARAWGLITDYAHGVTHDGLHVFCSVK